MFRLFRLEVCLSRKSSKPRTSSQTFLPGKMSLPRIIDSPEIVKDFFAWKISRPQIISISELFRAVFTRKIVVTANHQYPGNIQRLLRLEICLCRKSSKSRKSSKTFLPGKMSLPQIIDSPEIVKHFFA